jgi:Tfp pilus assembly protein PilX
MRQLCTPQSRQRGISLLTVMVMMLLSLLLVLGGSRVGLLNERVAGNSTDYQRAYEAAEALLSEAQLDLLACMTPYIGHLRCAKLCRLAGTVTGKYPALPGRCVP